MAVAVVVGAGPGLGAALCRRFARAGYSVAAARRDGAAAQDIAGAVGGHGYACDAAEAGAVTDLFAAVDRDLGTPEVVVFNAGRFRPGRVVETDPASFADSWRTGCLGGFHVGQAALVRMVPAGRGTILFTGATASLRGGAGFASLAVGKFGLRALAQSMAREAHPQGIHVAHVIIDGQIAAEGRDAAHSPSDRGADAVLDPDAIAEAYWQIHQQPRSTWTHELDLRPWVEKF